MKYFILLFFFFFIKYHAALSQACINSPDNQIGLAAIVEEEVGQSFHISSESCGRVLDSVHVYFNDYNKGDSTSMLFMVGDPYGHYSWGFSTLKTKIVNTNKTGKKDNPQNFDFTFYGPEVRRLKEGTNLYGFTLTRPESKPYIKLHTTNSYLNNDDNFLFVKDGSNNSPIFKSNDLLIEVFTSFLPTITSADSITQCAGTFEIPFSTKALNGQDITIRVSNSNSDLISGDRMSWSPIVGSSLSADTNRTIQITTIPFQTGESTLTIEAFDENGTREIKEIHLTITQDESIQVNAPKDFDICFGDSILLAGYGTADHYSWFQSTSYNAQYFTPYWTNTYTVTGTDVSTGCSNYDSVTVTVLDLPEVSVTDDLTICEGETVQIQATGAKYYNWNHNLGKGSSKNISPTDTTTYYVTGTDENGCKSSDSVTVQVVPQLDINIQADSLAACLGESINLSMAGDLSNIQWFKDSKPVSKANASNLLATTSGVYFVTGTWENCMQVSTPVELNVWATPSPTLVVSGEGLFCDGVPVTLLTQEYSAYQWYLDGKEISGEVSQSIQSQTEGLYSVKVWNENGCSAMSQQVDLSEKIMEPALTSNANTELCEGASVVLTCTQAKSYQWFRNGDKISYSGQSLTVSDAASYMVRATGFDGCQANSNVITTTMGLPPTPKLKNAGPFEICNSGVQKLSLNNHYATYQWKKDGENILEATNKNFVATESGTYQAFVQFYNGCEALSEPSTVTQRAAFGLSVNTSQRSEACLGDMITLQADPSNLFGYIWWKDGVIFNTNNQPELIATESGNYAVAARDEAFCLEKSLETPISFYNYPDIPSVEWDGSFLNTSSSHNIQWLLNGEIISGANENQYLPIENGAYQVQVSQGPCSTVSEEFVVNRITSIHDGNTIPNISVFPNPFENSIQVNGINEESIIQVTDMVGKVYYSIEILHTPSLTLDMSDLSNGTYLLIIQGENAQEIIRITKQ